ncbi:MAG: hypothetical protein II625_10190 [Bacilli bacterium]|nr:hypothetical protein [Bacilli bacterium]
MKKKLAILDIVLPLIMLVVLLLAKLSDNTVVIIMLTLFIGWVIPFFINIITGIVLIKDTHQKLGLIANFFNIILSLIIIVLSIRLFDKKLIVFIVEYTILAILSICNYIYFKKYKKTHPDKSTIEKKTIKEKKKKNNGVIV